MVTFWVRKTCGFCLIQTQSSPEALLSTLAWFPSLLLSLLPFALPFPHPSLPPSNNYSFDYPTLKMRKSRPEQVVPELHGCCTAGPGLLSLPMLLPLRRLVRFQEILLNEELSDVCAPTTSHDASERLSSRDAPSWTGGTFGANVLLPHITPRFT